MTRVVTIVLLAFVVFACGDPVNVEKRVPVAPNAPGLDLLGAGGLGGVLNGELNDAVMESLYAIVKAARQALEGLNVCPNNKGGHKDSGYGPYGPSYVHGDRPSYEPGYEPSYVHGNRPSYETGYEPGYDHPSHDHGHGPNYEPDYQADYAQSGGYKRDAGQTKLDFLCEIVKALIHFLKQIEKLFKCTLGKEKGYTGDYQDCKDEYYKAYPQAHKTGDYRG